MRYSLLERRLDRRLAGTQIHCVLLRKQTFRSSAGPRFKNRVRVMVRVRVSVRFRA